MDALLTQFKALSERLDGHLKKLSKEGDNELFYSAEADKLHMQQEVKALKSEITRCTKDLMEGLCKLGERIIEFQTRAFEDLHTLFEKYKHIIHGALVGNELLNRAAFTGFKTKLDGYRDILEELSAAVIKSEMISERKVTDNMPDENFQKTYDNLSTKIEVKIIANRPTDVLNYVTRPSLITDPHYSLDLNNAKKIDGPLLKPLHEVKEVLSKAIVANANEPITSVSLSLEKLSEKLPEKPMPDVLKWLETEHPNILGLHFGDVIVDVNRTIPALFVADRTKVNVYTLVDQTGIVETPLASIKSDEIEFRGGLLPVLNSKYLLVSEARPSPPTNYRKKHTVSLYKWILENDQLKVEFTETSLTLKDGKTHLEVEAEGTAWLVPKRLEERSATFYVALLGSSELHEILLLDNTSPPQLRYCVSNDGHHKLDGKLQSLGYRCTDDSGARVRIVASFEYDDAVYVYDSSGDPCSAPIERKIKIVRPQWPSEGVKWFNPLPLGDELVLVYNKPNATVHALRIKHDGEAEWLFENVDATDVMQTKVDLKLADWCLARLPTTNPAAVLLVANDATRKLEFYQLVLHLKAR